MSDSSIPRRIESAPLTNKYVPPSKRDPALRPPAAIGAAPPPPPPPQPAAAPYRPPTKVPVLGARHSALPSAPPAPGSNNHHSGPTKASAAPAVRPAAARPSAASSPAPAASAAAPATAPAAAPATPPPPPPVNWLTDRYPEDRIYTCEDFAALAHCRAPMNEETQEAAAAVWRTMPENEEHSSAFFRENLFRKDKAAQLSKVGNERKVYNEVLGILCRVTEENLPLMRDELTALPIRQSSQEDINQVLKVFFNKATRVEDAVFAPLYFDLILHLLNTYSEHDRAGEMIRDSLVRQCQETFVNEPSTRRARMVELAALPPEQQEFERLAYVNHQKANMRFLGQLYVHHLVATRLVRGVLDKLMFPNGAARSVPSALSITMFIELWQVAYERLVKEVEAHTITRYKENMELLSESHPEIRMRCLLLNLLEKHDSMAGGGPKRAKDGSTIHRELKEPEPDYHEVEKAMDDFFARSDVDEIVARTARVRTPGTLRGYCQRFLYRYLTILKYGTERTRLGELFATLDRRGGFTLELVQGAMSDCMDRLLLEEPYEDIPGIFDAWTVVVKNGGSVFPLSLHTELLERMVDRRKKPKAILDFIGAVHRALRRSAATTASAGVSGSSSSGGSGSAAAPPDRFRVLQALLRYRPPLGCRAGEDSSSSDDDDSDYGSATLRRAAASAEPEAEDEPETDIIALAGKIDEDLAAANASAGNSRKNKSGGGAADVTGADMECQFFALLCRDEPEGLMGHVNNTLKASPAHITPLVSALYTFVRYDPELILSGPLKSVTVKIFSAKAPEALAAEVCQQHQLLELDDEVFFSFIRHVQTVTGKHDTCDKIRAARVLPEYMAKQLEHFMANEGKRG